ncbi:NAD-dependent epimerase/dehydratase family protein [Flavobacterium sp.]|uniref:NAD-dependent epimerase/dehydratase family protein n=1 Tax=Flavobacterium sp. TaxID=239 RepID=UPI003753A2F5
MRNNQIILGSGGTIGSLLAKDLKKYTNQIRLFSRNPKKINEDDILISGTLLDTNETTNALQDIDVAYLVVGLPYETKVWERDFVKIVQNVINACKIHKTTLVFFDNVYLYDPEYFEELDEETPIKSTSKKGAVRVAISNLLHKEIKNNDINVLIVRSADFYGLNISNSMFNEQVINRILSGKKANWFLDANKKHSLTFVEDASKATAMLGNINSAYNQVWHLPTDKAYTANELVKIISNITGKPAKIKVANKLMITILGWFIPAVKESKELLYQYDRDYEFKSDKFQNATGIKPTSIELGLTKIIKNFKPLK